MLWSLIKILAFVAVVIAITYGAILLMSVDGGATITMAGYEIALSPLQLVLGLVLLVALTWVVFKVLGFLLALFHFLNGDETAVSRYFNKRTERRGFDALADGMMALAAGDGRLALIKADKADRYLNRPELTNLLTAQAAELAGDRKKAEETYKVLLNDNRTRFVGVHGLMRQKLEAGDTETAMKLAEKAFALRPKHDGVADTLLRLQAEQEDWAGARKTLGAKLKAGALPRDVHRRRDAVLALSEAKDVMAEGKTIEAREAAIEANRLSPDLIPAAIMAARAYMENNNQRSASRVLRKAWEVRPHPDLAAAYAEIRPTEAPAERIKRFRDLTRVHPEDPETKMLLAELHVAAEDFPEAKRSLGDLPEKKPTARVLTLMAAIERGEGADDAIVRGWLTKALTAPRGPQWICDNCHNIAAEWQPVCPNCQSFDTLAWKTPPQSEVAMPRGVEMLPLIVGQIGKPEPEPETIVDPTPPPQEEVVVEPSTEEAPKT
ncbi:heme biosynthesis protein HemY [Pelagovum pacificum]|uniref:Tetratricopeptide repeat protein n=1 Tax=Pelagovum pacificum TaxID=2588711 RepID=A0A5C5GJW3_9RHOB|nr:heme biosynthesis HemY N-terminal domain-containing protein [Pelagovum pacificum]QQA42738.1 tetratricopeptide repeat protein [Pelagovum pacificum]TNY34111.1 tetratricopeptide repeat protein [Pelagovum pacificum]